MANHPWEYEPRATYEERSEQFPKTRYVLNDRARRKLFDIYEAKQQAKQQVRDIAIRPEYKGTIGEALSYIGRPLAATSSALAAGLEGKDIGAGFMAGLTGQSSVLDIEDVMKRQGMPEYGRKEIGPVTLTGRGAMGFAGSVAADPLSYIPAIGWAGKALGWGGKLAGIGARRGLPASRALARPGVESMQRAPQIAQQMFQPSVTRAAATTAAAVPVAGRGARKIIDALDPRVLANDKVKQSIFSFNKAQDLRERLVNKIVAPLEQRIPFKIGPERLDIGEGVRMMVKEPVIVTLQDGSKVPFNDLVQNVKKYRPLIDDEQAKWLDDYTEMAQAASDVAIRETGKFGEMALEEGMEWAPRRIVKKGDMPSYAKVPVGAKKQVEFPREYPTQAEGIIGGVTYADPMTTLRLHLKDTMGLINEKDLKDMLKPFSKAVGKGEELPAGFYKTEVTLLKDMAFREKDLETIAKQVGLRPAKAWTNVSNATAVARTLSANFDLGAGFLQGLPLLARHPAIWFKSQYGAVRSAINPQWRLKYLSNEANQRALAEFPDVAITSPEFTEAARAGGALYKLIERTGPARRPLQEATGRAAAAFDAFGDVARTELSKSMQGLARRTGKHQEVADFINKITGVVSRAEWSVSPTQRAVESAMLFSPRYTVAAVSLVGDALLSGGVVGQEARKAIASLLVGGVATYIKFARMLGQEPNLDPERGSFLTFRAGNQNIGIGSVWVAMFRLLGKSITDPERLKEIEWQNPIVTWWRNRGSPSAQAAYDLIAGETFIGEELTPRIFAEQTGKRFLPFAAQSMFDKPTPGGAAIGGELLGMRTFPQNWQTLLQTETDRLMQERGEPGRKYEELDPFMQQEVTERVREIGLPIRGEFNKKRDEIFTTHNQKMLDLANDLAASSEQYGINEEVYVERRREIYKELATRLQDLENWLEQDMGEAEYAEYKEKRYERMSRREQAREGYLEILRQRDEFTDQPDFIAAEEYLASLTDAEREYIDQTTTANIKNLPKEAQQIEKELRQARKKLAPYWDKKEEVMAEFGTLQKWQDMTPVEKMAYMDTQEYKYMARIWKHRRDEARYADPSIDAELQRWYGYKEYAPSGGGMPSMPSIPSVPALKKSPLSRSLLQ